MKKITFYRIVAVVVCCVFAADGIIAQNQQRIRSQQHGATETAHKGQMSDAHLIGDVVDKYSGEHLPFINIQLKGTSIGTTTDETGHYFLKNLPVGEFIMQISCVGYDSQEIPIEIVQNTTQEINIVLEESTTNIDQVVVTGNRYETKQRETATVVNIIPPKLFENTASCNVAEVLSFQPGLRVESNCQNCGYTQLRINGLNGNYSQILIDGHPLMSSLASVYGLEHFPAGMIDRVEVIRGGGSALFGSNAIGGVVNIITKEPIRNSCSLENSNMLIGTSAYDINGTFNASLVSNKSRAGAFLFGTIRDRSPHDYDNDGYSELPKLKSSTIGFRSYYKTSNYSKLKAEYHHSYEFRRGGDSIDLQPHKANVAEQTEHHNDAASLDFSLFSADGRHSGNIYSSLQHINRNSYYGGNQDLNAYGTTKDLTSVTGLQYRLSWMRNSKLPADFVVGAEYLYNGLNDVIQGYNHHINQHTHLYGGFVQNEWKNKKLGILVGARLDKHSMIRKPIFSPRLNLRYAPIEAVVLRATYASGYRAPQAFSEDLHIHSVGGDIHIHTNSPELRPEYSHSINGSIDFYQKWNHFHLNILAEGFYTQLNNVFIEVPQQQTEEEFARGIVRVLRTNAESGAYVGGINLEAKLAYKKLFAIQMGYTYQQSNYFAPQQWGEDTTTAPEKRMLRTPDHYGYVTMDFYPFKGFSTSLNGVLTGPMLVPHFAGYISQERLEKTPTFFDMGIKVAYDIQLKESIVLQVNGGVKNIFNSYQKDFDKGANRDSGYIYGPLEPRSFYLGLKFKI